MPEISIERAKKLLNPKNPHTLDLIGYFEQESTRKFENSPLFLLGLKAADLPELVNKMIKYQIFPIVDKKTALVIGAVSGSHAYPITLLERYHTWEENPKHQYINYNKGFESFLQNRRGYFISSMRPDTIVVDSRYRPDRHDKSLFSLFKTSFVY